MNQKLVNEFNRMLEAIDEELTFEITKKEAVKIKYINETVCTLEVSHSVPVIIIDPRQPILLDKYTSTLFSDLIKLCGKYLDAFFDGADYG